MPPSGGRVLDIGKEQTREKEHAASGVKTRRVPDNCSELGGRYARRTLGIHSEMRSSSLSLRRQVRTVMEMPVFHKTPARRATNSRH